MKKTNYNVDNALFASFCV